MKSRDIAFWAVLLAVLVGILYLPTGAFGFLHLDDHDYTFRCPFVYDGLSWANVKAAFTNLRHAGVWMPLTYISYMLDISLFGPGPNAHHLVNVALHMINTILLVVLACRLAHGHDKVISWIVLAVAFWTMHPQRVEAVAWIASRKELLWAGFTLAGLLCWLAHVAYGSSGWWLTGTYLFCAFACMSKPTAMCFPLLAFCTAIVADRFPSSFRRWLDYLPLLLMALATGALAIYSQTHPEGHEVRVLFNATLPWRLLNAAVAIGLSLFQMFIPIGIHLDYRSVPGQFPLHGTLGLAMLCLAPSAWYLIQTSRTRHHHGCNMSMSNMIRPPHAMGYVPLLWFLAALVPTLGIFGSFGEHARADRFLYVPMMALALAAGMRAGKVNSHDDQDLKESGKKWVQLTVRIIASGYVMVMAVVAWTVIDSYRNDESVFTRTLSFDPGNGRALAHIGQAECAKRGGIDRGIDHLRKSQAIRPRDSTAAQLAYALAMRGHSSDFDEIRRLCSKFACDHQLDTKGQALEALGMTAMRQRRWNEAISCLYDSIRAPQRFYSNEDAMLKLAGCLCNANRQSEAVKWLEQLIHSKRIDIRGKSFQALETLKRNPRAVLFLD